MTTEEQEIEVGEVYDFLMKPHRKKLEIKRTEEIIEELRGCLLPGAIRYDKDTVQSSPRNQQEETITKIIDMEEKLERMRQEHAALILEVNEAIDQLEDPTEKAILTYYYVSRMNPETVAEKVGYSRRGMFYIKKSAVAHLCTVLH